MKKYGNEIQSQNKRKIKKQIRNIYCPKKILSTVFKKYAEKVQEKPKNAKYYYYYQIE